MYTAVSVVNGTGRTLAAEGVSSATTTANEYILFSLHIALSLFILFSNAMTVLAFRNTPKLRTQPHLYVLNLVVADGLVGIGCFHCAFKYVRFARSAFEDSTYLCLVICTLTYISACESLQTLLVMAVDRLVYIVYPYRYPGWFTEAHTKLFIGLSWLGSLVFGAVPLYWHAIGAGTGCRSFRQLGWKYDRFALPIHILAMLLVTGGCYGKIACVARGQRKKIALQFCLVERGQVEQRAPQTGGTNESSGERTGEDAEPTTSVTKSLTMQSARRSGFSPVTLFVALNCLFAVCWMPFVVHFFLRGVVRIPQTVSGYVFFLAMSNSAMNPVVLACKNRHFARAYRTLLAQRFGCCGWGGDYSRAV